MPQATALAVSFNSLLNYLKGHLYSLLLVAPSLFLPTLSLGFWVSPLSTVLKHLSQGSGTSTRLTFSSNVTTFQNKTVLTSHLGLSHPLASWPHVAWLSSSLSSYAFLILFFLRQGYSRVLFFWLLTLCWWADLLPSLHAHLCVPRLFFYHVTGCLHGYPIGTSNSSPTSVFLLHSADFPHRPLGLLEATTITDLDVTLLTGLPASSTHTDTSHSPLYLKNTFPKHHRAAPLLQNFQYLTFVGDIEKSHPSQ